MSVETRKPFNIEEQRAKDLLAAIKTITPVISLIREWGKAEKELEEVCGEVKKISKEIKTINDALEILSGNQVIEALQIAKKEKCELHSQLYTKREELKQICDGFEKEVISYQDYTKQFRKWINRDVLTEFVLTKLKTQNQYWALLFLVYNADNEIAFVKSYLKGINFYPDVLGNGWNYMLKYLKNN